jgi:hypothetical protein
MPWLRFIRNYDFHPNRSITIAYKAGVVVRAPEIHVD